MDGSLKKARLTIETLFDLRTGESLAAHPLLNQEEGRFFELRRQLGEANQKGDPFLVCSECHQPVEVRGQFGGEISRHFKHQYKSDDCPIKTDCSLTKEEIERRKFNGAKESAPHFRIKHHVADMLRMDPKASEVEVEEVIHGRGPSKEWRKPDIQLTYDGIPVVLEIQLSTTFITTIIQRELFYREQGIHILWIFNKFDPLEARFTEKDIFYSNKRNAFVVDDETIFKSERESKLSMSCFYPVPAGKNGDVIDEWVNKIVGFEELEFDSRTQRLFYYDYDKERLTLENKLLTEKKAEKNAFELARMAAKEERRLRAGNKAIRAEFKQNSSSGKSDYKPYINPAIVGTCLPASHGPKLVSAKDNVSDRLLDGGHTGIHALDPNGWGSAERVADVFKRTFLAKAKKDSALSYEDADLYHHRFILYGIFYHQEESLEKIICALLSLEFGEVIGFG